MRQDPASSAVISQGRAVWPMRGRGPTPRARWVSGRWSARNRETDEARYLSWLVSGRSMSGTPATGAFPVSAIAFSGFTQRA